MKPSIQRILFLMAMVTPSALFCQTAPTLKQDSSAQRIALAAQEVERIKALVQSGIEAPIRLSQAEQDLADAQDRAILDRTQYAEPVTAKEQTDGDMVAAAERRVNRQKDRIEQQKKLIADGLVASRDLTSLEEELSQRELDLYWAQSRVQFRIQADELAKQRSSIADDQESARVEYEDFWVDGVEHYEGVGTFDEARDLKVALGGLPDSVFSAAPDQRGRRHRTA